MGLRILNAGPDPEALCAQMKSAILEVLPGADIAVTTGSAGHFNVSVTSDAFSGKGRVAQHQMVYRAITSFMTGSDAPVHAIDSLETRTP